MWQSDAWTWEECGKAMLGLVESVAKRCFDLGRMWQSDASTWEECGKAMLGLGKNAVKRCLDLQFASGIDGG